MTSIRRLTVSGLVVLGAIGGGLAVPGSAPALVFSRQLTGYGEPAVSFHSPVAVTTNAAGDLYVADEGAKAVDQLGLAGEPLRQLTGWTNPALEFEEFGSIRSAATNASGDLYVVNALAKQVDEFGPSGESLVPQLQGTTFNEETGEWEGFGTLSAVAVDNSSESLGEDPSKGDVYVADPGNDAVHKFSASGEYLSSLEGVGATRSVAVDASGNVYVADSTDKVVDEFSPAGVLTGQLSEVPASSGATVTGAFGNPRGVAVDDAPSSPSFGDVYIADSTSKVIDELTPTGGFVAQLNEVPTGDGATTPGPFGSPVGVAVDGEGNLYVADSLSKVVDEFGVHPPPQALLSATVSGNEGVAATLHGTVDPEGSPLSSCEFEYGANAPTEQRVPCAQSLAAIGSGTTFVAVSGEATGLTPDAVYHYQLAAVSAHGTSVAEGGAFTAAAIQPSVQPAFATDVTQFTATLNGALNPEYAPVSYHFAYVEAAHYSPGAANPYGGEGGQVTPVPDIAIPAASTLQTATPEEIAGLKPGTTYDFALVASGPGGTRVGPNASFTTPGIPLPAASTGGAAGVSEAAATLTGAVNPEGWETTYNFQYGTTPYGACALGGQSWPTVPIVLGGLDGAQGVSVFVERLQPNTTYFYRTVASNAQGTVCGGVQSFRTSEYPASIIQETPLLGGLPGTTKTKTTTKPETNAQKLAAALKSCKKEPKKKQAKCKAQAKKKYAPKKAKAKKKK